MRNPVFDRLLLGACGLVAILVATVVLNFQNTRQLNEDAGWVTHTREVMDHLQEINSSLWKAESIQRTFLIVGGDTTPENFDLNIDAAKHQLDMVKELTDDNQEQQDRIPVVKKQIDELASSWAETMRVRKKEGFEAARRVVEAGRSRNLMSELQGQLRQMDNTERALLLDRSAKRERTYYSALATGLLSGVAAVGGVVAFAGLLQRHLAERSAATAMIAEQGERLRTTLASIGDAVITTDTEGRITTMNAVSEALTGWSTAEAVGQPLDVVFRIVNEQTRQSVANPAARALNHGVIVGLANHTVLIAKDGTERPIDDSAAPIRCKEGQVVGCVLVFRDVTERRQMEGNLRKLAGDLSEADRRKDEFLATLAHELRNPLAPIRNALQIIPLSSDRQAREQARALIERQLVQMVRLVDDLLDVSRITRGKLELRKEQAPLAAIISNAVETSQPLIDDMAHELTIRLPEEPIIVDADVTRLAQVFANLLNNSAKYTDRGGHIWLTAERQGDEVVVSVKDTGVGIGVDQLPRLFEIFSQGERSLERAQGGLGIGLTLVKRLVEMHGGKVEVKSDGPGKGAEFLVRLPIVVPASRPQQAAASEEPAALKSSLRILVVDDNRDGADSLAMLLRIMGNDTRTAYEGQDGLDMAEEFRPDVLLLDIGLPKLNGYDACRRIRERPWGQSTVIIAVTGWGQEEDRRRSQEAGFNYHLVKPVDPQGLVKLLAELNCSKK